VKPRCDFGPAGCCLFLLQHRRQLMHLFLRRSAKRPGAASKASGKSIAESFLAEESMSDADLSRRQALYELLAIPDPPDIHRGHVLRFQGKPERHRLLPQLAAAFVQAKLLEIHERAPLDEMGRTA
jgi:hypothetical protein